VEPLIATCGSRAIPLGAFLEGETVPVIAAELDE
jgi:hypothetical protein